MSDWTQDDQGCHAGGHEVLVGPLLANETVMIRVLVVDDQVLIRAGMSALIGAAPDLSVAGEAATGEEAVSLVPCLRPDVVLMDIRLPGISGITATERITAALDPPPRILILTSGALGEDIHAALQAGAAGFLLKDTPPERLLAAIRTVASGDVLLAASAIKALIGQRAPGVPVPPDLRVLTRRETQVVELVGRMLSNRDIAEALSVSEATVKTHLNRAMAKLGLSTRAQMVALAYDCGLVKPRRLRA